MILKAKTSVESTPLGQTVKTTTTKHNRGTVTGLQHVDLLFQYLTCFSSEPLYQEYRATVITKEIRRQTVCRNISKTSVDYAMDRVARRSGTGTGTGTGNGAPRGSPVPTPGQSTLWQELPTVRESGVLEQLTPEQCKYQEVRD